MFTNEYANRAYELYNGKRVLVRGKNVLGGYNPKWDRVGTARVYDGTLPVFGPRGRHMIYVDVDTPIHPEEYPDKAYIDYSKPVLSAETLNQVEMDLIVIN